MEKDIDKLKKAIEQFIEKYTIKTLKINTDINCRSKINDDNPQKWVIEYKSKVEKIDINLTK